MLRRGLAAALLAVALPQLALAEPAVIRVFEAAARAEPSKDAAVLETFPEKAQVSVSEESKDGWRRVRLSDGRVGWLEERAIAVGGASAQAPAMPAVAPSPAIATPAPSAAPAPVATASAAAAPDLRAHIYVKDLGHLAELVKEDAKVGPMADRLAKRRRASIGIAIVGGLVSTAFLVAGASKFGEGPEPGDPDFMEPTSGDKQFAGGVIGMLATGVVTLAVYPRRGEVLDVVNTWNVAHPDRPFELEHGHPRR